jgi:signal transduction histidine kinase
VSSATGAETTDEERRTLAGLAAIGLVHDLRNLLGVAETSAFVAQRSLDADRAKATHHLGKIATALREAQRLIDASLAMARGEPMPLESCSAIELARSAAGLVPPKRRKAPGTTLEDEIDRLSVETPAGDASVACVKPLAIAAIINVIKNALEVASTRVTVSIAPGDSTTRIIVADDGPGFPEGFAIAAGQTTKATGQGIGLATARATLRSMGGALLFENDGGARVTLEFRASL